MEQNFLRLIFFSNPQGTTAEIILNSLDILTFVVPPILPAALTANNAFAQRRLEKQGIFCLHSKHISLCGGIDIVAFDKVILIAYFKITYFAILCILYIHTHTYLLTLTYVTYTIVCQYCIHI